MKRGAIIKWYAEEGTHVIDENGLTGVIHDWNEISGHGECVVKYNTGGFGFYCTDAPCLIRICDAEHTKLYLAINEHKEESK